MRFRAFAVSHLLPARQRLHELEPKVHARIPSMANDSGYRLDRRFSDRGGVPRGATIQQAAITSVGGIAVLYGPNSRLSTIACRSVCLETRTTEHSHRFATLATSANRRQKRSRAAR